MLNEFKIMRALAKRTDVLLSENLQSPNRNFWELWLEKENPQDDLAVEMIEEILCSISEYCTRDLPSHFLWVEFEEEEDCQIIEHAAKTPIQATRRDARPWC